MKKFLTLCLMLLCSMQLWAQDCYNSTRSQGIALYNQGKYTKAKSFFTEAKNCPDAPVGNDLDTWIGKCNTAIDTANQQAAAAEMARKGYMQITTIRFCNEDADNNMIDPWGATLYAGSVCYLTPAVVYRGLDSREHTIKLQVKIFEDNLLSQSSSSPEGYTFEKEITVKPGENTFTLPGWGSANPGSYGQTSVVRLEIYYNGRKLKSQEITLQHGIKPQGGGSGNSGSGNSGVVDRGNDQGTGASYLRVDNKTTVNSSWSATAGTETYYVSTDGNNYKVWLLPSWCRLTARTATSFTIAWENNPGGERTDWFEVVSNGHEVRINVTQAAGNSGGGGSSYSSVDGGNDENTGATYLRVDNKTDVNSSWSASAGSETYYVSTDGSDYLVKWLPSWATLTARSRNSFTISWEANTSITRKDWFRVTTNGINVDVQVTQAKAAGARDASYLKVDNKTEVSSSWSGSAGSETYYVSTDATDYHVTLLPSWCEVTNKTSTSFTISWEANTSGSSRSDWFRVESGDCRVKVNVTQSTGGSSSGGSSSYGSQNPNALSRKEWATLMRKAVDYVGVNYDNGAYKGQRSNNLRHGLGVYWWSEDGDYHWGRWENGEEEGMGIYMLGNDSYHVNGCEDCRYFVGMYDNGVRSGKGTCYDSWGNLIYYGDFVNGQPSESYPNGDGYTAYKFEVIQYTDGAMYVGETKDGQRHGYGIYLWPSGASWYGPWENGSRDGYGIYLPYQGTSETGTWRGDTKVN